MIIAEPGTNTEAECVNLVRSPGIDSLESIPCSRFLGFLNVYKFGLCIGGGGVAKDMRAGARAVCIADEMVFVNLLGGQESIPRNRFRQSM